MQLRAGGRADVRRGRRDRGRPGRLLRPQAARCAPRPVQHGHRARLGHGDPDARRFRELLRGVRADRGEARLGRDRRGGASEGEGRAGRALRGRLARRAHPRGQGPLRHRAIGPRRSVSCFLFLPLFTNVLEVEFCEVRLFGILRTSHVANSRKFAPGFGGWHHPSRWKGQGSRELRRINAPMRSRPPTLTVAAILLVLLSLFDFPWPYMLFFPGAVEPPAFIIYSGYVLGIVGIVVAIGLWRLNKWSYWATIVVCVLNFLLGAPGVVFAPGALKGVIVVGEVVAVLIVVLVVLPSSRRALSGSQQPSSRVR